MTEIGGAVERMDFIVTNTTVTAPDPALRHLTDYWDTDRQETRNGPYRVTVIARDLGGYRATDSSGAGAATTSATDVIVCNGALATAARDTGDSRPAVPGVFQLGNRIELVGHNFFTPLNVPPGAPGPRVSHPSGARAGCTPAAAG